MRRSERLRWALADAEDLALTLQMRLAEADALCNRMTHADAGVSLSVLTNLAAPMLAGWTAELRFLLTRGLGVA